MIAFHSLLSTFAYLMNLIIPSARENGNFYHKGWGLNFLLIFPVFISLLASAINVNPVNAAETVLPPIVVTIDSISEFQNGLVDLGNKTIFQQACTNDVYEPDNDSSQAKTISTDAIPQSHVNTPSIEEDWVKFSATAGHQYEIRTRLTNDINQGDTAANDTFLYLYDTDEATVLASNDDVGYTTWYNGYYFYRDSIISWTAPSTGVFFVRELQWGPLVGYTVRDCHTYDMWVEDLTILTLVKSITLGDPYNVLGGTIAYSYAVTNDGKVGLAGPVTVTDDQTLVTCPNVNTVGDLDASLDPGESLTCSASHTVTQADLDAGSLTNLATAHAAGIDSNLASKTANATQNPELTLDKTTPSTGYSALGDSVSYNYNLNNTGNVTLSGPFTVSDDKAVVTCPATASLAPDASIDCTASYSVTQTDLDAGFVTNTATGHASFDSSPMDSNEDNATVLGTQIASLELTKTGVLNINIVPPNSVANVGDTVTYMFSLQNTGNVTLTNIVVSDPGLPSLICSITSLAPGVSVNCASSNNNYSLIQADINTGSIANTATATGKDPNNDDVIGSDSSIVNIPQEPVIGIAKRMVGNPVMVSPGTWDVTFNFLVKNYGNVPLSALQVMDNMSLTFPAPTTFTIWSVSSAEFAENWSSPGVPTDYNGNGISNLLTGVDSLAVGGQGMITLVVRIVPASVGPFDNSAIASGLPPSGPRVADISSEGTDPDHTLNCSGTDSCINDDDNPNNNTKPTWAIFTENLYDPPFGVKSVNSSGLPELSWTMVWINGSNIVAVNAAVSDPIPVGSSYVIGSLSCTGASALTTTATCAYEIPSIPYPRGRVVWTGTIGPDFGALDADAANNELYITFKVTVNSGVNLVQNIASLDSDLNGDGNTTGPGEQNVSTAGAAWTRPPNPPTSTPTPSFPGFIIPNTGFAPGRVTVLPAQTTFYNEMGGLWLEVPRLGVKMPIVGVPQVNGKWDVSWLGNDAGWLNGSAYPTWNGNSVLTGHVTDASGNPGPFARLNTLMWGDDIIIHVSGAQYVYEVRSILQVRPGTTSGMMKHEASPWVTLVTCRGYDVTSDSYLYRILVRAVLVEVK